MALKMVVVAPTERKRKHSHQREARASEQHSDPVTQILKQSLHVSPRRTYLAVSNYPTPQ